MITLTSLQHPTMNRKLRNAVWLAKLEATAKAKRNDQGEWRGKQYVVNRKGNNIMRIDWHTATGLTAYGDCSMNITHIIRQAMQASK